MPPRQGMAVALAWHRFLRNRPRLIDASLALTLFALSFPGSRLSGPADLSPHAWWTAVILTGIACLALPWRRTRPLTVAVIACTCALCAAALGFEPTVLLLGTVMVALFTLADHTSRRTANSVTFTAAGLIPLAAALAHHHDSVTLTVFAPAAILVLPTALGTTSRYRRAFLDAAQARADDAERTREQEARNRATAERIRIARELHDVVAHHFALAHAQAGVVAHLMRTDPDKARDIATDLVGTTSTALRELKATVSVLRQSDEPDSLAPAPGLAQLPDLATSLSAVGLQVTVSEDSAPRPLSPGVDLTAYRITQEALTNVTKHAPTRSAHVQVSYALDLVTVSITNGDDGLTPIAPSPSSGFGLLGMRERAHSVGGSLHTGPRPGGGYAVIAELPLHPAHAA